MLIHMSTEIEKDNFHNQTGTHNSSDPWASIVSSLVYKIFVFTKNTKLSTFFMCIYILLFLFWVIFLGFSSDNAARDNNLFYAIVLAIYIISLCIISPVSWIIINKVMSASDYYSLIQTAIVIDKNYVIRCRVILGIHSSVFMTVIISSCAMSHNFFSAIFSFMVFALYFFPIMLGATILVITLDSLYVNIASLKKYIKQSIELTANEVPGNVKSGNDIDVQFIKDTYISLLDTSTSLRDMIGYYMFSLCFSSVTGIFLDIYSLYITSNSTEKDAIVYTIEVTLLGILVLLDILISLSYVNELGMTLTTLLSSFLLRLNDYQTSSFEFITNMKFIRCMDRSLVEVAFWGKFVLRLRMVVALFFAICTAALPHFLFK